MRFGSLFSGIGGIDLGLERAGMECAWQVEIDEWCRRVLTKHWPDVPKYGDIKELNVNELEPVDLVCGGPPCQPFSSASGKTLGTEDERWLWPEFVRFIRHLRPRFVLVENVSHLRRRDGGALHVVLGDLASMGFDAEWASLRASDVGAPHKRERIFLVAYTHGNGESLFPVYEEVAGPSPLPGSSGDWRVPAPGSLRVANGVPSRVDRLRGLGNAVVPQVAEWIGHRIMERAPQPEGRGS